MVAPISRDVGPLVVDLSGYSFPRDAGNALEHLQQAVSSQILEFDAWYLRDKRRKRTASRALRAAAIILGAAGGVWPLIAATWGQDLSPSWGYVLLALAAALLAFDRFFGLSIGWMRDITAHNRLVELHSSLLLHWTAGKISPESDEPVQIGVQLDLLSAVISQLHAIVAAESADWASHFSSQVSALDASLSSPADGPSKTIGEKTSRHTP